MSSPDPVGFQTTFYRIWSDWWTWILAARVALRYTAKYHYDKLIVYTDNSKVEQLLKRPKKKDYNNYPKFFKVLNQCHREIAMVDRKVRQKRRRHERKFYFNNDIYDLQQEIFVATFIASANRQTSSFF
jgi:hypothetical protein